MKKTLIIESPEEFDVKYENLLKSLKNETEYKVINRELFSLFGLHPIFCLPFPTKFSKFSVFRAVKPYEQFDKFNVDCYSYPRPNCKVKLNRANIVNQPVLYCATDPKLAIEESKISNGDIFFLSNWYLNLDNESYFPLFYESYNRKSTISEIINKSISDALKDWGEEQRFWYEYKLKKFTDLFTKDGAEFYNISSAIAYKCFYEIGNFSIIVYPSVKNKGDKYNFAIKPEFVDNKSKCNLNTISEVQLVGSKINVISQAILIDNNLYWDDVLYSGLFFSNIVMLMINGSLLKVNIVNKNAIYRGKQILLEKLIGSLICDCYKNIKSNLDLTKSKTLFVKLDIINLKSVSIYSYFDDLIFESTDKIDMIYIEGYTTYHESILLCTKIESINI